MQKKKTARIISALLILSMLIGLAVGLSPTTVEASADKVTNIDGFQATMVADPDTSTSDQIFNGSPAEDGKIWTDKSVTTGTIYGATAGEKNFNVALSAMAQTYSTVTAGVETSDRKLAYDVVFVLDFSASMKDSITGGSKAQALVDAVNPALATLMENENNRVGIVGYSGDNVGSGAAATLFELDHYKTADPDGEYVEYSSSSIRAKRSRGNRPTYYVTGSDGKTETGSKNVSGGTPTQRGIYQGMKMLEDADKPQDDVTRIPVMVLLTDGQAGVATDAYNKDDLRGGTVYEGTANGVNRNPKNAEVAAYTMLTANYAKDILDETYGAAYDYDGVIEEGTKAAKFYTIGLGIQSDDWTHFMLEPSTDEADRDDVVTDAKTILRNDSTYGNNYDYADKYFGGTLSKDDLEQIFKDILEDMEVEAGITTTVKNPVGGDSGGGAAGSDVTFTDYLGYKMELKGEKQYLRYESVNYEFIRETQADGSIVYKFNNKKQDGTETSGPVVTVGEKTYSLKDVTFKAEYDADKTVNGQTGYWKVTWKFPSALLPTYSRADDYKENVRPIRMLYEIGLIDEGEQAVDFTKDGLKIDEDGNLLPSDAESFHDYAFYTNLYNFYDKKAEADVKFQPALDNPYYYKTGYTLEEQAGSDKYVRVDMSTGKDRYETVEGTADVTLENVDVKTNSWGLPQAVTFRYDGKNYEIGLNGSVGGTYEGTVWLSVTGKAADGSDVTQEIPIKAAVTHNFRDGAELQSITVNGEKAQINGNTATANDVKISEKQLISDEGEQILSIYMKLKQDAEGWYTEDLNGNRIDVKETEDGKFEVIFGKETYYSNVYYKYPEGTSNYVDKELEKGQITRAYVGQFEVKQPAEGEVLDKDNFGEYFKYHTSDGTKVLAATGVLFPDGTTWGTVTDTSNLPEEGTFRVMVDGIKNSDFAENEVVNFDFTVSQQTTDDGVRYTVTQCAYWEPDTSDIGVDVHISDTPEVIDGTYRYDVSYTITTDNPDDKKDENNKTHTDSGYFTSHLANGSLAANFGNNGRVSVLIDGATYNKAVAVKKQWVDANGDVIDKDSPSLADLTVTAGLYQTYSYVDENGDTITQGKNAGAFSTVELNQSNGFAYTWEKDTLPLYLVDDGGNYIYDENDAKVPVTYTVSESARPDGWSFVGVEKTEGDDKDTFVLSNTPMMELSPTVTKVWTKDGEETEAPDGYSVKMELQKNGKTVTDAAKYDTRPVTAKITQATVDGDADLLVTYRDETFITENIAAGTIPEGATKTYTGKLKMEFGQPGSDTYADEAEITVKVANTYGGKLGISDATITYYVNGQKTETLVPAMTERTESGDTKTVDFTMSYVYTKEAVAVLSEENGWDYTWNYNEWHLPMVEKQDDGTYKPVVYTVKETLIAPDGKEYTADANGLIKVQNDDGTVEVFKVSSVNDEDYNFTITNDLGSQTLTAEKKWVDNDNEYGTRPDSITFYLTADGQKVDGSEKTFDSSSEEFAGTKNVEWTDVPVYDETTGEEIEYQVVETMPQASNGSVYETTYQTDEANAHHFIVTNQLSAAANTTSMHAEKVWQDDNDAAGKRPDRLYMVLYRQTDRSEEEVASGLPDGQRAYLLFTDETLEGDWTGLPMYNEQGVKYTYFVKEYEKLGDPSDWKAGVTGYEDVSLPEDKTETSYKFTNKLEDGTVSKTVTKVWKDAALEDQRPENVTVLLSGQTTDGNAVDLSQYDPEQVLSADAQWAYTWDNLPEYHNGMKIDYTIEETKVGGETATDGKAGNYEIQVTDDGTENAFTVTNTLAGTTTVTVEKEWNGTPDGFDIPDVDFEVIGENDEVVEVLKVTDPTFTATAQDLPKYNADGEVIAYTVKEVPTEIPDDAGYTIDSVIGSNTANDGTFRYLATNTYRALVQDITGTKTWEGVTGANIPSDITVALYRTDKDGNKELVTDASGNALQPTWDTTAGTTWSYTYNDQPIYQDQADPDSKYTYSIEETKVGETEVKDNKAGDYTVSVNGMNITNTLGGTVDESDLQGTKTWTDVEEENIPDSIEVRLMRSIQGGTPEELEQKTVKKDDQKDVTSWTYDFSGTAYPQYDADGNLYQYYVEEVSITAGDVTELVAYTNAKTGTAGDYEVTLDGMNITNRLKADADKDKTVTYPVTKKWIDADGQIPESITIQLMRNGVDEGAETVLKAETYPNQDEWKYEYIGLRKYADDGITPYKYTAKETKVENTAVTDGKAGDFAVTHTQQDATATVIENRLAAGNEKTSAEVTKEWLDAKGAPLTTDIPSGITVQLYRDGEAYGNEYTFSDDDIKAGWKHTFADLPKYQADGLTESVYTVKETAIVQDKTSYPVADGKAGAFNVTENGLAITNRLSGDVAVTETSLSGTKTWVNADGGALSHHPDSVTVQLYQDGKAMDGKTAKIGAADNWTYRFDNLPKYQSNGVIEHVYTVKETLIGNTPVEDSEFDSTVNGNNIQNELKDIRVSYTGEKIWKDGDNADQTRPASVEIELLANGTPTGKTQTVKAGTDGKWNYTFDDLAKYDSTGKEIAYSVRENNVDEKYNAAYEGNNVINTLKPGSRSVTVTKHWEDDTDAEGYRPDSINFVMNGVTYTMKAADHKQDANTWSMTITGLPRYDATGEKIVYNTPVEETVEKYTTSGFSGDMDSGFTITNTLTLGEDDLTNFTVQKVWKDNENAYGTRPASLKVQLYQDGVAYDSVTLNEANKWTHTFENLPKKAGDAEENHVYTAKEEEVPGYVAETENGNGYTTFTNTLTGTQNIDVTKIWANVSEDYRPTTVRVELQQNGKTVDTADLTAANNWKHNFGSYKRYDANGAEFVYQVVETQIDGKDVSETDYLAPQYNQPKFADGKLEFEITNTLDTSVTDVISGTKTWVDNDNAYKLRPESITVHLMRGEQIVETVQVAADENGEWKYEFADIPRYDKDTGAPIVYTVAEEAVENYFTTVNGYDLTNVLDETKIPQEPEEPKKPEQPKEPAVPKTGDTAPVIVYILGVLLSLAVVITGIVYRVHRRKQR